MGGDSLAFNSPTFQLRLLSAGCTGRPVCNLSRTLRKLTCSPKGFWSAWKDDLLQPQQDWRISPKELLLSAHMKSSAGIRQVTVLVDTGSRIPLVFRRGLVPSKVLKTASFPVKFKTADGNLMLGGTHGLLLELRLPVASL